MRNTRTCRWMLHKKTNTEVSTVGLETHAILDTFTARQCQETIKHDSKLFTLE